MGVQLFVGGHAGTVQGEREDLAGFRCYSARHKPQAAVYRDPREVCALLDSGAFSDAPDERLTPEAALERQFNFEREASQLWGYLSHLSQTMDKREMNRKVLTPLLREARLSGAFARHDANWRSHALVSYDLLIDEVWTAGQRQKRRWTVEAAEWAVRVTIEAARYLSEQRARVEPRTLVLACQGVDAVQYDECVTEVLRAARPHDWIGLGGWCILGRFTSWMPVFWQTINRVLPRIAHAGVSHVHIFGVLYQPALGGLLWLADQYGLTVSTDSAAPVLNCTWKDTKKAGVRAEYWRDNVQWWKDALANIRESEHYREPPTPAQQTLWEAA